MSLLSDSGVTRTFALKFANSDSNFMELFSEEASIEEKDPKVVLFIGEQVRLQLIQLL